MRSALSAFTGVSKWRYDRDLNTNGDMLEKGWLTGRETAVAAVLCPRPVDTNNSKVAPSA